VPGTTDALAERVRIPHAGGQPQQSGPLVGTPVGTPSRTGSAPRSEGGAFVRCIHPALAEPLLLLALAGWLRLAGGLD
jgi:hypothetical protein